MLHLLRRLRRRILPDGTAGHRLMQRLFHAVGRAAIAARAWLAAAGDRLRAAVGRRQVSWASYSFRRFERRRRRMFRAGVRTRRPDASAASAPAARWAGEKDLVSVVLPVYNGRRYVREALESVLAQTHPAFELIAVDDGSTDDTPAILAEFAARDARVRVIRQENRGLPAALNAGFRAARGAFFTWISDDNRFKPDFLARMVVCLRRRPRWDMIYANIDIMDERGAPLRGSTWYWAYQTPRGSEHVHFPADPSELNVIGNNYIGAAFLYRRRAADVIGEYDERLFGLEDYDYWMRVNALLTLRHADFDEPVYEYRLHGGSLTARDGELNITRRRDAWMIWEDFRRDFYLTPMLWVLEPPSAAPPRARPPAGLARRLRRAGQLVSSPDAVARLRLPRLWAPVVHVASPGAARAHARLARDELAALDIRVRAEHLRRIQDEIERAEAEPAGTAAPEASVVVCTRRRAAGLRRALESIVRQDASPDRFEVVVVDNSPADPPTRAAVEACREAHFRDAPDRLRLVDGPLPGLSAARNAGLGEARGGVVCFLDDDAVAEPTWLSALLAAFREHPEAGVIGGRIIFAPRGPTPRWLRPDWREYWSHFDPPNEAYAAVASRWAYPWGANWAARRGVLLRIGGFRTRYGRRGSDFGGGEEIIAAALIARLGYSIGVEPRAVVRHEVDPARLTAAHVRRTIRAAIHTQYQSERDLYFPMGTTPGDTWRAAWRHLRDARGRRGAERRRGLDLAAATFSLWRRRLLDEVRRLAR